MVMDTPTSPEPARWRWRPGFTEYLLGGILVLMVVGALLAVFLYVVPPPPLELAELQPAYRVTRVDDFPVNGSRLVHWGDRVILVVRTGQETYAAVQGTAPLDGCILDWEPSSLRIVSPCSYLIYDPRGNVVQGLTTEPLQRYPVFVRDGVVYLARS